MSWPGAGIRIATASDVPRLLELTRMLGYTVPVEALGPRVERLLAKSDTVLLVADADGQDVSAWILAAEHETLETGRRCEILGLVVDPAARRGGVGRRLVAAVESWARDRDLASILVRSNVLREESHPFYERLGFSLRKTQHVYAKPL